MDHWDWRGPESSYGSEEEVVPPPPLPQQAAAAELPELFVDVELSPASQRRRGFRLLAGDPATLQQVSRQLSARAGAVTSGLDWGAADWAEVPDTP